MKDTRISSKQCPRCKNVKDKDLFHRSTVRLDRMSVYCKDCENEYKRQRAKTKKEYDIYGIV